MGEGTSPTTVHVVHVIGSLAPGGAELVLARLVESINRAEFRTSIITLLDDPGLETRIREAGVPVYQLHFSRSITSIFRIFHLWRLLRALKPDIVQAWLYHSNNLTGLLKPFLGKTTLLWSIRHSGLEGEKNSKTVMIARLSAFLSRMPERIVCVSRASIQYHDQLGYNTGSMIHLPNGYDTSFYRPDPELRSRARQEWGRGAVPLIGAAGRYHPVKDFQTFLKAAAYLLQQGYHARFLMCGSGLDQNNEELLSWIRELGLEENVLLLGRIENMPAFYNSLDLFSLTSISEAFPNVLAEAMACGVPCVTTDVGDASDILGGCGRVVPVRDPAALAQEWMALLDMPEDARRAIGLKARQRVEQEYSLEVMVNRYEDLYRSLT